MNYLSGEQIKIGDSVLIERGHTPGVVEYIVETAQDMNNWNLKEKGVLLKSTPFGSVFWPMEEKDDPVAFVSRDNT